MFSRPPAPQGQARERKEMSFTPEPDASTIAARIASLRVRVREVSQKTLRLVQGAGTSTESVAIHSDVKGVRKAYDDLRAELKVCAEGMDPSSVAECEKILKYIATSISTIERDYNTIQSRDDVYNPQVDMPDMPTLEGLKLIQQEKENQLDELGTNVKLIKRGQERIHDALDEAAEVEKDLEHDIDAGKDQLDAAVGRMHNFQSYLKKNKAPMLVCILTLVIMILMWASKAFCSWGLTWQCP